MMTINDTRLNQRNSLWPLMLPAHEHGNPDLCLQSAQGVWLTLANGKKLLCGTSGLWNVNLGYGNKNIAAAAKDALLKASYLSVWGYENEYAIEASRQLVELAGKQSFSKVLFSTCGGAANDMAMKLVRHYQHLCGHQDKKIIIAFKGGFHGLTFGASSLTDASLGHSIYGIDQSSVAHIAPNNHSNLDILMKEYGSRIAGFFLEPLIGSGAVTLDNQYLEKLFKYKKEYGFIVVADEVTTGFGRVENRFFVSSGWKNKPDIIITAKGLTNGTQACSALIVSDHLYQAFCENNAILGHAETQAGTPVACASILSTIEEFNRLNIFDHFEKLSNMLDNQLDTLVEDIACLTHWSGKGLLRALHLVNTDGTPFSNLDINRVIAGIRQQGATVHPGPGCIQILPSLAYQESDIVDLVSRIYSGLGINENHSLKEY